MVLTLHTTLVDSFDKIHQHMVVRSSRRKFSALVTPFRVYLERGVAFEGWAVILDSDCQSYCQSQLFTAKLNDLVLSNWKTIQLKMFIYGEIQSSAPKKFFKLIGGNYDLFVFPFCVLEDGISRQ